ncbi:MAG: 4Fe-4S binding protein [Candidatus Thermoplasmatota archaeon]|nr:4Fe-4S binding protein [Candidatus Thermoplasmatota archaeon]
MTSGRSRVTLNVLRTSSRIFFFLIAVLGIFGVSMTGLIYPYFFCPASPAACAGCPIWVIEHGTINIVKGANEGLYMLLYLLGLFLVIGVLVGRSFCGWACPMGTLQDIFSFFDRVLKSIKWILVLAGASLAMLVFGIVFPYVMREAEMDILTYMWAGYIGALGAFLSALSGVMLLKRKESLLPPIILVVAGVLMWVLTLAADRAGWGFTPLASIELMGLLGLMFGTIGSLGVARFFLRERVPRMSAGSRTDRRIRWTKYGILLAIAPTSWLFDTLFFTDYDPIGGITATLPELLLDPSGWSGNQFFWMKAIFVVGVITLISFVDRGWCRYLCPVGAMYAPLNKVSISDIEYTAEECIHCQLCIRNCPMGLNPKEDKRDPECIRCGRCVTSCPTRAQRFVPFNRSLRGVFGK